MGFLHRLLPLICFAWAVLAFGPAAFAQETGAADEPARLAARPAPLPFLHGEAAEEVSPLEPESPEPGPAGRAAAAPSAHRRGMAARDRARSLPGSDILLLIQRQNE